MKDKFSADWAWKCLPGHIMLVKLEDAEAAIEEARKAGAKEEREAIADYVRNHPPSNSRTIFMEMANDITNRGAQPQCTCFPLLKYHTRDCPCYKPERKVYHEDDPFYGKPEDKPLEMFSMSGTYFELVDAHNALVDAVNDIRKQLRIK